MFKSLVFLLVVLALAHGAPITVETIFVPMATPVMNAAPSNLVEAAVPLDVKKSDGIFINGQLADLGAIVKEATA